VDASRRYEHAASPPLDEEEGVSSQRLRVVAMAVLGALLLALAALAVVLAVSASGWALPTGLGVAGVALVCAVALGLAQRRIAGTIEELSEREAAARELADQDPLTGLGNYRLFWRQTASEAARIRRHGGAFSLALLDLDSFKAINDELGHRAGDETLQLVAVALSEVIRAEDLLCRHGGDEFAVIAVEAGPEQAEHLAGRLVEAVSRVAAGTSNGHPISATAGWATFGVDADNVEDLVLRADEKLRAAKRGRQTAARPGAPRRRTPAPDRTAEDPAREAAAADPQSAWHPDQRAAKPDDSLRPAELAPTREAAPRLPAAGELLPSESTQREHESRLSFLGRFARALAAARNERAAVETAVAHLAGALDALVVSVLRLDHDRDQLSVAAFAGPHAAAPMSSQALDSGLAGAAVRELAPQVAGDAPAKPADEQDDQAPDARSQLAVPVIARGEIWGVIDIASDKPDAYSDADVALVEAVAVQLGRALTLVWAFEQLVNGVGETYRVAATVQAPGDDSWRVADLAWRVGRELGLTREALEALYLAALFHDVGTVGVPTDLLVKPGRLTGQEMAMMREHTVIGERLLRPLPRLRGAARIVRSEHERYDGGGYPDGLAAEDIPLASRVLLAVDAYVAMTSARPFRLALGREQAITELRRGAGSQLDPLVVETLLDLLERDPGGGASYAASSATNRS
jgi:diguanylate cyclase (GGDEF)-like protein